MTRIINTFKVNNTIPMVQYFSIIFIFVIFLFMSYFLKAMDPIIFILFYGFVVLLFFYFLFISIKKFLKNKEILDLMKNIERVNFSLVKQGLAILKGRAQNHEKDIITLNQEKYILYEYKKQYFIQRRHGKYHSSPARWKTILEKKQFPPFYIQDSFSKIYVDPKDAICYLKLSKAKGTRNLNKPIFNFDLNKMKKALKVSLKEMDIKEYYKEYEENLTPLEIEDGIPFFDKKNKPKEYDSFVDLDTNIFGIYREIETHIPLNQQIYVFGNVFINNKNQKTIGKKDDIFIITNRPYEEMYYFFKSKMQKNFHSVFVNLILIVLFILNFLFF